MDLAIARKFLAEHHRSVLCTHRADGRPQMSPVVHAIDEEGRVCISTREPAFKVRNLTRDPRASVLALSDGFQGQWVQADGTAEIVRLPEAMDLLIATYRQVAGEHPDWDDYRQAMERDQRVIIRITIGRAGPDRSG